jgi:putative colanic acid biosynthesis UDP-glucose lipid carrier transferase
MFRQERIGRHHKLFTILKFRTMRTDAEAATGPVWSTPNDERVTALGRFLRKTHLDELPQLINVLRGEMALIGPRPERPCFVEQFRKQGIAHYDQRHEIRGGITGYAQILSPTPTLDEIVDKTQSDIWYIQNWSVGLDCWIAYRTAIHMLRGIFQGAAMILRRCLWAVTFGRVCLKPSVAPSHE